MDPQAQKRMEAMLAEQEKEFKGLMKEYNLEDEFEDVDPDMADLHKELKKQERLANAPDDEEPDENDLLAELGDMDEDQEAAKIYIEQLQVEVMKYKKLAVKEKQANNIPKAKEHLAKSKELEAQVEEQYKMYPKLRPKEAAQQAVQKPEPKQIAKQANTKQEQAQVKPAAAKEEAKPVAAAQISANVEDDIEMEEQIHDNDKMVAMSVIENEMGLLTEFIKKSSGHEKEFFQDKFSSLEFSKSTIESNIQIGIITPDKYLNNIKKYLAEQQALAAGLSKKVDKKNKHLLRVLKRIQLVENEIKEMENPEPEVEENPPQMEEPTEQKQKASVKKVQHQSEEEVKGSGNHQPSKEEQLRYSESKYVQQDTMNEDDVDWSKADKHTFDVIVERIADYRDACQYVMEKLGDRKKALDLLTTAEKLAKVKETVMKGKKIDLLKIDPPVSPAVILGYDDATRLEKFNEIIKELTGRFEEHKQKAGKLLEASKQVKKKEQVEHLRQEANDQIAMAKKFSEQITEINQKKRNPWQAPPVTHQETVFIKKEKTIADIKPGFLRIHFKTSESLQKSGCSYVKLYLNLNEQSQPSAKFYVEKDTATEWSIDDKTSFKVLDKKEFTVALKKKKFLFGVESVEKKAFKLPDLTTKCEQSKTFTLKSCEFTLVFQLNMPLKQKEYEEIPIKKTVIDTFPEPYRLPGQEPPKKVAQPPPQQQQKPSQAQPRQTQQKPPQEEEKKQPQAQPSQAVSNEIPEGLSAIDIKDPDNMGNMNCSSYIEKRLAAQQQYIQKCAEEGIRIPPDQRQKLMDLTKQKMTLQNQIQSGKVSEEQYKNFMNMQLAKDRKMLQYFMQHGDAKKAQIVKERIATIQAEIQE